MRIAVCDDCLNEREQLVDALHDWDPTRQAECFADGASLLEAAKHPPAFDLVFLDIYMPGENGVEIAEELKRLCPGAALVFVTATRDYAVEAFSLRALHYLVKPVTAEDVAEVVRRMEQLAPRSRPTLALSAGRGSHTVHLDEICCLQSVNHAVEVSLTNARKLKVWTSLGELEQKLDESFLKLNRGTIVNMAYIEQMGTDVCMLRDGTRLVLPRRERAAIRAAYDNYLFSCLAGRNGFDREVRP